MAGVTERFAPSPTGLLHLGHAYSAFLAHDAARAADGRFLLRIEDVDTTRLREGFVDGILDDMRWLGLDWDGEVLRQSQRTAAYRSVIAGLEARGLIYACTCSRKDIQAATNAPQEGDEMPPAYPGLCRGKAAPEGGQPHALRLDMAGAVNALGGAAAIRELSFRDVGLREGMHRLDPDWLVDVAGDIVLARKDGVIAYHLAVVVDDALQEVSHVTRAEDLFSSTPIHRVLQALLSLPVPIYRHHAIIRDRDGKRLAKRDGDEGLAQLRASGKTAKDIRAMVGLSKP